MREGSGPRLFVLGGDAMASSISEGLRESVVAPPPRSDVLLCAPASLASSGEAPRVGEEKM